MIKWIFPPNSGGQESGFHDAGVETFKGNLDRFVAREAIQNSLDARDNPKKPVVVNFQLKDINAVDIPDMKSILNIFKRCEQFWPHDKKAIAFFQNAIKLAKSKTIKALRIGDFNTTGITGRDTERGNNWYSLIRCSGASSKGGGEGGSFGIGKNAPFAASRMRTVIYSTLNKDKEFAFQGVAKLVSHKGAAGKTAQATGYLGASNGSSIRDKKKISASFLRTKQGTDIFVLGYHATATWETDLVYSVLENFWPAIHFGDLEVQIGSVKIAKSNLKELLEKYSAEENFSAHLYYKAYISGQEILRVLPILGKTSVHLLVGDAIFPKRVAMIRKTGMVIYFHQFRSVLPFCGVFLCRNDAGNRILREMEPPRHDQWDPDHPEQKAHRKTEAEFIGFLRECIKELMPSDESKVMALPELSQYLPDDDEAPDENFTNDKETGSAPQEGFDRKPEVTSIKGRQVERNKKPMQPDSKQPGDGESETEGVGAEGGTGGGPGQGTNESDGGTGGAGGGTGEGNSRSSAGSAGGSNSKIAIPIRYRTFVKDLRGGVYVINVEPNKRVTSEAIISISTVGDDASLPAEIMSARLPDGSLLSLPRTGVIGPLTFPSKGTIRLEVTLKEPRKVAMEVEAHEA